MPYLLNRKVIKLDYIIISHFDTDHCDGLLYIMEKIKVETVIIGKQYESSENYDRFKRIVKEKNIKVKVVGIKNRINIESDLYIDVLWPNSKNMISENAINNNSLVCKLVYKNFSIMFTGDIESIAEKAILTEYLRTLNLLRADVLKVAHHGSKTSSIEEFIDAVNPDYAIIGVGEDNKFGHPSNIAIKNLKDRNIEIYRTDKMGEIIIKTDGKKCSIRKYIENKNV